MVTEPITRLLSSHSTLTMPAKEGSLIKCVASILTSFWQSVDLPINLQEPPMAPVLADVEAQAGIGTKGDKFYSSLK